MLLVKLRIRYLKNTVQVFMDLIYCILFDREIEDLYIAWRKAQQIVWGYHISLIVVYCLMSLICCLHGEVLFSKIFLKHFVTGYCNKNIMVSTVFRLSMCNVSYLDNNIRVVCFKNDIDLHSLHTVSTGEMNNTIIGKWSESVSDEDKQGGMQVELCIERDSLNEWVFDRGDIFDIILIYVPYS